MASDELIAELVILSKNMIKAKLELDHATKLLNPAYDKYAECVVALIAFDRELDAPMDTDTEEAAYKAAALELDMDYDTDKLFSSFRDEFHKRRMEALTGTSNLN